MSWLIETLQNAGSFIIVLGVVVFVHEFGHFIVAKSLGIGVPVFSLGFGPRLLGFRRGETDYRISLIPLGGYVRLSGDEADENRIGAPEEFLSRPRWQRLAVFVAGATFNVIAALAITWSLFWVSGRDEIVPSETPPIVAIVVAGSNAEIAGIEVGDRVISVDGLDARDPRVLGEHVMLSPDKLVPVILERDGERMNLQLDTGADPRFRLGAPGWGFTQDTDEPPTIQEVVAGAPAERAGIQVGDRVLGVNGREPVTDVELREILAASGGVEVELHIDSGGEERTFTVVPEISEVDGRARIGVLFRPAGLVHRDFDMGEALVEAVRFNVEMSTVLFRTLGKLVTLQISPRALSGPMEIAQASKRALFDGWRSFFGFVAFISLQLGIINLLPIPVLDGGHILIIVVEGVMRRELTERMKERVMQVGLVFLLLLFVMVIYLDIAKALPST